MFGDNATLSFVAKILDHRQNPPANLTKTVLRLVMPRSAMRDAAGFITKMLDDLEGGAITPSSNSKLNLKGDAPIREEELRCAIPNFAFFRIFLEASFGKPRLLRDPELSLAALDLLPKNALDSRISRSLATTILQQIVQSGD